MRARARGSYVLRGLAGLAASLLLVPSVAAQSIRSRNPPQAAGQQTSRSFDAATLSAPGKTRAPVRLSHKGEPLIFVSDERAGVVDIFSQSDNELLGNIAGFATPLGLNTDTDNNLYVPQGQGVPIYAPPYSGGPKSTLDDAGNFPVNLAASRRGVLGVVNACNAPSCTLYTASVTFHAKNSMKPCATVADSINFGLLQWAVFDANENLYVTGRNQQNADTVGVVKGGCHATKIALLTTNNQIVSEGAIQIDKAGRVAILNESLDGSYFVDAYNPPTGGSLGSPVSVTRLQPTGSALSKIQGAEGFTFNASGTSVYIADFLGGVIDEYDYPAGGLPRATITSILGGLPFAIAVTPPLVP